jgi:hypothetical protein
MTSARALSASRAIAKALESGSNITCSGALCAVSGARNPLALCPGGMACRTALASRCDGPALTRQTLPWCTRTEVASANSASACVLAVGAMNDVPQRHGTLRNSGPRRGERMIVRCS